jgi:BirA family biotin operon repressor/biotin-[acetyl-CoA-carboxylase] ligase
MKFIELDTVGSTNGFAKNLLNSKKIDSNTVVFTYSQTQGKGCGTNSWHSEDNKNILFSLIYFFDNIEADQHFLISVAVSLGICDYIKNKGINCEIKWPNDIFVNNKKLCGILIENSIQGNFIQNSIIGVGININQTCFPNFLNNAISVSNVTNKQYNLEEEITEVSNIIFNRLNNIKNTHFGELKSEYLSKLYRFNIFENYKLNFEIMTLKIIDVELDGHIVVEDKSGYTHKYYFKELEFIL